MHHLKRNLHDPRTRILIVDYQAHGSLGRLLVERAPGGLDSRRRRVAAGFGQADSP
jgi:Cft2 family RNA processing exonuclease